MTKQQKLETWVCEQHKGQTIKGTTRPYFDHVLFVADKARLLVPLGYDTGLCHDLLEKTKVTAESLYAVLLSFGYTAGEANDMVKCVTELTNVFTKKNYPNLRKKKRKELEAARLLTISAASQTVKYADLLYNIRWVAKFEKRKTKASKYFSEKHRLLLAMDKGAPLLRAETLAAIDQTSNKVK